MPLKVQQDDECCCRPRRELVGGSASEIEVNAPGVVAAQQEAESVCS